MEYGQAEPLIRKIILSSLLRINLQLILQNPQNLHGKKHDERTESHDHEATYGKSQWRPIFSTLSLFVVLSLAIGPLFAHANIISFMSGMLGDSSNTVSSIDSSSSQNTQKMALLEAPTNSNPQPKIVNPNVWMVNGAALSSENGIIVPNASSTPNYTNGSDDSYSDQISLYTVHTGDTLQQVANMFNVTPNTILWANNIKKGQSIIPGQVLVILPISGVKYTVKKGDTLQSIAKALKGDTLEITRYNNLDDNATLAVGDIIIIPEGEILSVDVGNGSSGSSKSNGAKSSGSSGKSSHGRHFVSALGGSSVDSNGFFIWPLVGGVRTQGLHGHNGIDFGSSYGTPILASASGHVVLVRTGGWDGGYGNYIVIQHNNGMQTLYAHLSGVDVSVGQDVSQGQTIGRMGSTGDSTGVHLHFEVRGGRNPFQ